MGTTGKVVGPGGSSKSAKSTGCSSIGPGGTAKSVTTTTQRGYESSRTSGLRTAYQENGSANNAKA